MTKTARDHGHTAQSDVTGGAIHSESAVVVRSDAAPNPPTAGELATLLGYPVHSSEETRHYRTAPEGFEQVARTTLANWAEIRADLKIPGVSPDALQHAVDTRAALLPIETKLAPYYQRAYDNRREADSDGVGVLYKLARAVKGSGDPALKTRFAPLLAWIASHHAGPHSPKGGAEPTGSSSGGK